MCLSLPLGHVVLQMEQLGETSLRMPPEGCLYGMEEAHSYETEQDLEV